MDDLPVDMMLISYENVTILQIQLIHPLMILAAFLMGIEYRASASVTTHFEQGVGMLDSYNRGIVECWQM